MEEELNFCEAFYQKTCGVQGIDNKTRYLLEDFFYNEGWASQTNPKVAKEGYSQQYTYNKSTIAHFIEDFVRLFKKEFKEESNKIIEALNTKKESSSNIDAILKEAEFRINECLKDTNKKKDEGQPEGYPWKSEALGYKTSLECIKRTREKFAIKQEEVMK